MIMIILYYCLQLLFYLVVDTSYVFASNFYSLVKLLPRENFVTVKRQFLDEAFFSIKMSLFV